MDMDMEMNPLTTQCQSTARGRSSLMARALSIESTGTARRARGDMGSYSISNAKPNWFPLKDCPPDPNNDPSIIQYCGFEGFTMNFLHSPVATVYTDRAPQISPALWIGDCFPNGTTKQGWTQDKLRSFLLFLDSQNIQRIGLWCMTNESDPIGFPCPVESCPWIYEELEGKRAPAAS